MYQPVTSVDGVYGLARVTSFDTTAFVTTRVSGGRDTEVEVGRGELSARWCRAEECAGRASSSEDSRSILAGVTGFPGLDGRGFLDLTGRRAVENDVVESAGGAGSASSPEDDRSMTAVGAGSLVGQRRTAGGGESRSMTSAAARLPVMARDMP